MFGNISETDPEIYNLIIEEERRQREGIELIASENFVPISVLQANASIFTNKYSEGYPNRRYYGGNAVIDRLEILCQERALKLFDLDPKIWGVNVQALSGSPANFAVYTALVGPGGRIMGLDLPCGGHLTHGYQSKTKKVSATSLFFESLPYKTGKNDLIDYDDAQEKANLFKPQILICGYSSYPRDINYSRMRQIADSCSAFLMADISHINGFVSAGILHNPFVHADIVTTTTHKIMRGPRGALIFFRKSKTVGCVAVNIEEKINSAVFPGLQGGPHNHTICAIAVALKIACSDEYKKYVEQVASNAKALSASLIEMGYEVVTGGTDTHIVLIDLTKTGLSGSLVERACEIANITVNKNCIPSSSTPFNPKGIRLGTCAMTTRGLKEADFEKIAQFLDKVINITLKVTNRIGKPQLKYMNEHFESEILNNHELAVLKSEIIAFSRNLPYPAIKFD